MKKISCLLVLLLMLDACSKKDNDNSIKDISGLDWHIWLDRDANWTNDSLYLPPVDLSTLPYNAPTCGWEKLYGIEGQKTHLPATVEEYTWNENGNQYGISGNYKGVSWFYTVLYIPKSDKGKRLVLDFESVRMRAEVFVNNKLSGYDLIDGTPFQVDISDFVKYGDNNNLAIRITDPNGNFNWRDSREMKWGKHSTIISHGFGGITGKVQLHTTDQVYIDDVYVKNRPEINSIDAVVQINNISGNSEKGEIVFEIAEKSNPNQTVFQYNMSIIANPGINNNQLNINLKDAKLWSPEKPNLYTLKVIWRGEKTKHCTQKDFGFRWFEVIEIDGNRQFLLNNTRIVLRSAISWSFWPVNGIYPTNDMAKKQVAAAKKLGLNMLNFHRAIGYDVVFQEADSQGLLYYEEPGGYRTGVNSFSRQWAREKLLRMVKRDRSHPSLIIYNMQNELGRDPEEFDKETIKMAHEIDETRFITYTSTNFSKGFYNNICPDDTAEIKMHMLPYDNDLKYFGYWDQHHAGGSGCYQDGLYNSPNNYLRYTDNKKEIVFYGEEGAIGTPPQLPIIIKTLSKSGKYGWDGLHYKNMYEAYDHFLTQKGFYGPFKDMESLLTKMGNVALYYQGRVIENIRANNLVDGYVVNGWESEKIENHSGIVDVFRNIKGNAEILAYYNQPTYVAVKVRNKVIELGESSLIDFFLINESNIKGKCELKVTCSDSLGIVMDNTFPVEIVGGNQYGQLLISEVEVSPVSKGYCEVKAELIQNNNTMATGKDEIFSVTLDYKSGEKIEYGDDKDGDVYKLLTSAGIENLQAFNTKSLFPPADDSVLMADEVPSGNVLVAGFKPPEKYSRTQSALLDWIMDGNTLIIVKYAELWAEYLNQKEVVDYRGYVTIGKTWYGGNHFVREHPLFDDLPVNCVFDWEYQCLAQYKRKRLGLRLYGDECIVGVNCEHKPELFTAVGIIHMGRGKIIISTLDLEGAINSGERSAIVAKKILQNYVEFALAK